MSQSFTHPSKNKHSKGVGSIALSLCALLLCALVYSCAPSQEARRGVDQENEASVQRSVAPVRILPEASSRLSSSLSLNFSSGAWFSSVRLASHTLEDSDEVAMRKRGEVLGSKLKLKEGSKEKVVLRFAVVADLNGRYGSTRYSPHVHNAIARIIELKPDLVLSAGDMVAGQRKGLRYRAMWRAFHRAVSDPLKLARIPFVVAPGNHDASAYRSFAHERRIYAKEWRRRRPAVDFVDKEAYPFRHAFREGPVLFVALDATIRGPLKPSQRAWLDVLLTKNADAPVKIVYGHVPLFPFAEGHSKDEVLGDAKLEALLNRHKVDLVVSGHHQAFFPGKKGNLRVVGLSCLGGGTRTLIGDNKSSTRGFLWVEVGEDRILSVDSLPAPDFITPLPRASLPPFVGLGGVIIIRDDLDPSEVPLRNPRPFEMRLSAEIIDLREELQPQPSNHRTEN